MIIKLNSFFKKSKSFLIKNNWLLWQKVNLLRVLFNFKWIILLFLQIKLLQKVQVILLKWWLMLHLLLSNGLRSMKINFLHKLINLNWMLVWIKMIIFKICYDLISSIRNYMRINFMLKIILLYFLCFFYLF